MIYLLARFLPICYRCIEYLVCYILNHFSNQFFLYRVKRLRRVVLAGRGKAAFKVLRMVFHVNESNVYCHTQLYLRRITFCRNCLIKLLVTNNFTAKLQVPAVLQVAGASGWHRYPAAGY